MSGGFYDSDPFGDPFCPPPVPTSTPVTCPFAQNEQPLNSPFGAASLSGKMASMTISPLSAPPTPVGNPFEEPDLFAASPPLVSSKPLAAPAVVTVASMAASSLPFQVLHQASAPVGMAVVPMPLVIATPPTPQQALYASPSSQSQPTPATKPVFRDASDFDPYSPSAKKKAALAIPTSQPALKADAASDLFSSFSLPAPKTQQQQQHHQHHQQQQQAPQRQLEDDSWNIEWKPEAPKNNKKKEEDNKPALASSSKKSATATPTSGSRPSSSPGKTTTEAASAIAAAAAAASPSTKLPDGVLLARVSTRSIFVREWKPVYWVIVNQRLWIYRSKSDYNPTDYIKDPFNERIKKCIPLRECLRITELKSKMYPGENRTLYTFGLEDMDEDGGKSLMAKFAAYNYDDVRALREEIDKRVFEARHVRK